MDPAERGARLANDALAAGKRAISDQHAWALVEVACASAPDHLVAVRRAYRSLFGCSLEEDVAACPALQLDPLGKLLVSLVRSYRCETEVFDGDVARLEAAQLAEAVEVIRIVSTRSKAQLRATFQRYEQDHGADIDEVRTCRHPEYVAPLASDKTAATTELWTACWLLPCCLPSRTSPGIAAASSPRFSGAPSGA
jgi:annexin A7/11